MKEKLNKIFDVIFGTMVIFILAIPSGLVSIYKIIKEKSWNYLDEKVLYIIF